MKHLFTPEGLQALHQTLQHHPLLAFDFDGTLVPIIQDPHDARLSTAATRQLQGLTQRYPVALISGRSVDDLKLRVPGIHPLMIIGNHGLEDADDPTPRPQEWVDALNPLRDALHQHASTLKDQAILIEDKRYSIALHYRAAPDRPTAQYLLRQMLDALPQQSQLNIFGGKELFNVVAAHTPDKADALFRLVERCQAQSAIFLGDDLNDEPVFNRAPAHFLTVKITPTAQVSKAKFFLKSPEEVSQLMQMMLDF